VSRKEAALFSFLSTRGGTRKTKIENWNRDKRCPEDEEKEASFLSFGLEKNK
jgi:hypothetical protein